MCRRGSGRWRQVREPGGRHDRRRGVACGNLEDEAREASCLRGRTQTLSAPRADRQRIRHER